MNTIKPGLSDSNDKATALAHSKNLQLEYSFTVRMGDMGTVVWAGHHLMPRALDPLLLCSTQVTFQDLFESFVQKPFVIYVTGQLQEMRDALRKATAERQKQEAASKQKNSVTHSGLDEPLDLRVPEEEYEKLPDITDWLARSGGTPNPRERPKSYVANPDKADAKKAA